jgi:predicted transcriptional regulator YdeE
MIRVIRGMVQYRTNQRKSNRVINTVFKATFNKGVWVYEPNFDELKKSSQIKGKEKERPQFQSSIVAEKEVIENYKKNLSKTVLDIAKYLKTI